MNAFVLINGAPTGPMSLDQLRERMRAGQVNMASLAWMEGFANWVPISSMPVLVSALLPPLPLSGGPVNQSAGQPPPIPAAAAASTTGSNCNQ